MIVVSCCNYAFCEGEQAVFYPGDFDSELTKDCIGYTDTHFRTISDRKHRAVAGLSLGSAQALPCCRKSSGFVWRTGYFPPEYVPMK